jgi:mannose-1-phosphate guanylyltransferase
MLALIGVEPEEADPELGYIIPGASSADGSRAVGQFVEKPQPCLAQELFASGALWNSFIFAASATRLLALLRARVPEIVEEMSTAVARDARPGTRPAALQELYQWLPPVDFSRTVLQGSESTLRVVTAKACGWSDLGTPARVAETLQRVVRERRDQVSTQRLPSFITTPAFINLAAQQARLGLAGRGA